MRRVENIFFLFSLLVLTSLASSALLYSDCPYRIRNVKVHSWVTISDKSVYFYHVRVSNANQPPPNIVNEFIMFFFNFPVKKRKIPLPFPPVEPAPSAPHEKWLPSYQAVREYCIPVSVVAPVSWRIKQLCNSGGYPDVDCGNILQDWDYDMSAGSDGCDISWLLIPPYWAPSSFRITLKPQESVEFIIASYGVPAIGEFDVFNDDIAFYDSFYESHGLENASAEEVAEFMRSQGCTDKELDENRYTQYITHVVVPDSPPYPFNVTDYLAYITDKLFKDALMYGFINCEGTFSGGYHSPPAFIPSRACPDPEHCCPNPPCNYPSPCSDFQNAMGKAFDNLKSGDINGAINSLENALGVLDEYGCATPDECNGDEVFRPTGYGLLYYNIEFVKEYLSGQSGGNPSPPFFRVVKGGKQGGGDELGKRKRSGDRVLSKKVAEEVQHKKTQGCPTFWCWIVEFIRKLWEWLERILS